MSCPARVSGGEVYLLYNVLSVSAVQQRDSAVSVYTAPPSWASSHRPQPTPLYPQRDGLPKPSSLLNAQLPTRCLCTVVWLCQSQPPGHPISCPHHFHTFCSLRLRLCSCPALICSDSQVRRWTAYCLVKVDEWIFVPVMREPLWGRSKSPETSALGSRIKAARFLKSPRWCHYLNTSSLDGWSSLIPGAYSQACWSRGGGEVRIW